MPFINLPFDIDLTMCTSSFFYEFPELLSLIERNYGSSLASDLNVNY